MFAVIFEVLPKPERYDDYLAHAKLLRPEIERIDGFIDNDRFASTRREGWILSLSTWRDEKSVVRWRTHALHHEIQEKGRFGVFRDYHLWVGEIVSDTHVPEGHVLREQRLDETEVGEAHRITVSQSIFGPDERDLAAVAARLDMPRDGRPGLVNAEVYHGIYHPDAFVMLCAWRGDAQARAWQSGARAQPNSDSEARTRQRIVRVVRTYSMGDRREAPQFYPPVKAEAA